MKYHNITKDDMLNGDGLRVVLWLSGCIHNCKNCHNSFTSDYNSGLDFDEKAKNEIFSELEKDYIDGITFSGGDPLFPQNLEPLKSLIKEIKSKFSKKTIWLYTGYTYEEILDQNLLQNELEYIDVLIDGKFDETLKNISYQWAGSTNQRVIDIKKTLTKGTLVLYENTKERWNS